MEQHLKMGLEQIRIILVEPRGPLNLGSIARVMKNFGLNRLVLVNPECDPLSTEAQQMAVHAVEVLHNAEICSSLAEALTGCYWAVATTVRQRTDSIPLEYPSTALPRLMETDRPTALIFGPEERGLSNAELGLAQSRMQIPTHPGYPSLNLAQTVGLCSYELFQQRSQTPPVQPTEEPASLDSMEDYLAHLSTLLFDLGYIDSQTRKARMAKFRQLLHRATPTATELALLRGVISQVEWAIQNAENN
jgi:tRNA/rRNA methyltransferase